jgi:hypothetical protein
MGSASRARVRRSYCRNSKCAEHFDGLGPFCPSCRYLCKWALACGSFIGGVIVALIRWKFGL